MEQSKQDGSSSIEGDCSDLSSRTTLQNEVFSKNFNKLHINLIFFHRNFDNRKRIKR